MAQSELTQSEYSNLKSGLAELSDNKAAAKYHVGKRRVAMVRRSKSYAGYLQIRRNEQRKAAESRPAVAKPGVSELPQENAEFLAQTDDGLSLPADQTVTDTTGTHDARTDEQKATDDQAKAIAAKNAAAREKAEAENKAYVRRERRQNAFAFSVLVLAVVGAGAIVWGIISLVF